MIIDEDVQHIIMLARQVGGEGFDDLQEEEVQEELLGHALEELSEEELVKEQQRHEDEDEEEEGEVDEVPALTVTGINKGLLLCRGTMDYFFDIDPSIERSVNFNRAIKQVPTFYKELLKELKRQVAQPPISMFFLPPSTPSPTPSTPARKPQPPVHAPPPPDSDSDMDNPPPAAPSSDLLLSSASSEAEEENFIFILANPGQLFLTTS
ncbi:hypothetical protein Hamer_G014285 [Homarus americanus]|uniref:Uncharacterized protein n=1 Tax=Homarus americanus TaxID=6706 RepID=A0A8J5K3D2_HOMAM|nr:hypothetical protein Hamer_G014285 [Homarus americanus]